MTQPANNVNTISLPQWLLHTALFVATVGSCMVTGFFLVDPEGLDLGDDPTLATLAAEPSLWLQAFAYAASILAILFVHEMGHYLPARRYNVQVSLPYFIPGFPPFGTFGAFIRMQMSTLSSSRLFRIGVGGPLAGFAVALPILVVGFLLSEVRPVPPELEELRLGDSLLLQAVAWLTHGDVPEGHDIFLHPMGYAGWVGMFVTAFNLTPLGQLDGGHICFTMFGRRFNAVAPWLLIALIVLGLTVFPGWLVLAAFVAFMEPRHPPVIEGPLIKGTERVVGYLSLLLFVITFTPRPFGVPTLLDWVLGQL